MLKEISFFPYESNEFRTYYHLYNHPQNNPWMHYPRRLDSVFYHEIFLKQSNAGKVFIYQNEHQSIGICRLILTDKGPYKNIATIASVCIDPKFKGKGHGKKLLAELTQYVERTFPQVSRLELSFEMDNPVAMLGNVYDNAGFKREAYFSDWFRSNDENYQARKHPWYSGEWFSGKLLHNTRLEPNSKFDLSIAPQMTEQKSILGYCFRKAFDKDITELYKLYEDSLTEFSHYIAKDRNKVLAEKIKDQHIFVICNSNNEIVGACNCDEKPVGLEQLVMVNNTVGRDTEAVTFLFEQLSKYYQSSTLGVKRIELKVPSANKPIITALYANSYEYTGTQAIRFCDVKGNYFDELCFEYSLFGLSDAIECCRRRFKAEINLTNTSNDRFYLPLPFRFLSNLKQKLAEINKDTKLTSAEEKIIFKLVRIICTQDCHSAEERMKMYETLYTNNKQAFSNPYVKSIYEIGLKQLLRFTANFQIAEEKKWDTVLENKLHLPSIRCD